jgi:hypothetical protein
MNPVIPHVFAADPAGRVWPGDDRLWIYASHDEPGTNTHDTMRSYHAFSTHDMVNWTDYGVILHLDAVPWASSHMWALDCILWRGLYTLVYCAVESETGLFRTGLAVSSQPQGPFEDRGFIEGVDHGQDPAMFVDDDGTPYLFWGSGGNMHACELSETLRSAVPGTYRNLTQELKWAFEGPWVHKHNGKYILSYPGLYQGEWPESMYYAVADRPLGPYKFAGEYIPRFPGQAGTNHGSILEWKGKWWALHHSMWHSNISTCRSLMIDELQYDTEGGIKPIAPSLLGSTGQMSKVTIRLEAENGPASMGALVGVRVERSEEGYGGLGYVCGFDQTYHGFTVVAQVSHPTRALLSVRYQAPAGEEALAVMVNDTKLDGDAPDQSHDNWVSRFILPPSDTWAQKEIGEVELVPGNNRIRVYRGPQCTGGLKVDAVELLVLSTSPAFQHNDSIA